MNRIVAHLPVGAVAGLSIAIDLLPEYAQVVLTTVYDGGVVVLDAPRCRALAALLRAASRELDKINRAREEDK